MRILLFGKSGQVGRELARRLASLGELIALDRSGGGSLMGKARLCGDLCDHEGLVETVRSVRPGLIVNAAAYTSVDRAEAEPELARAVNSAAPGVLAREARRLGAVLFHYSTDYVFDGHGTMAWREADVARPLNIYGCTKLAGEDLIRASGCSYLILRTSWVFGLGRNNFLTNILRLAEERDSLRVVSDRFGSPTSASLVAEVSAAFVLRLRAALHGVAFGTYHLAARGSTTWYDFARYAITGARARGAGLLLTEDAIHPIATEDYPLPASRPRNSRLDCRKLESALGLTLPPWELGVDAVLDTLMGRTP